jgi:RNA polymerase sigma-70 factor (ECF subfamily)
MTYETPSQATHQLALGDAAVGESELAVSGLGVGAGEERLNRLFEQNLDFVWRSLRRLGVPLSTADDATQQVWLIVAKRLPEIAVESERSFLFGTAMRVASDIRRSLARRREVSGESSPDFVDPAPQAEELLDRQRERSVLDELLEDLPDELRAVFVLYELEEQTATQIAELLGIPTGTAASRLRRARAEFDQIVKRHRARGKLGEKR